MKFEAEDLLTCALKPAWWWMTLLQSFKSILKLESWRFCVQVNANRVESIDEIKILKNLDLISWNFSWIRMIKTATILALSFLVGTWCHLGNIATSSWTRFWFTRFWTNRVCVVPRVSVRISGQLQSQNCSGHDKKSRTCSKQHCQLNAARKIRRNCCAWKLICKPSQKLQGKAF